jgi:O-antigen/teichoic acid export membrane protein
LTRDAVAYGIAVAVDRLTGLLLLPLLTALMAPSVFGAWNQVLAAMGLFSNILLVGFYHSIVRYVPGAPRGEIGRVLHGMLAMIATTSGIFLLLAFAIPALLSQLLFATPSQADVIPIAAAFIISECIFEFVVLAFLRADERIVACAVYYVIKSLLRLALLWQGLASGAELGGLLGRLTVANAAIVLVAYFVHVAPTVDVAIGGLRSGFWKPVLAHSGMIVLSSNLSWANVSLNRFLIVHILGLVQLGVYAANYSLASIINLIALIVNFTVIPHLNAAWNRGDKKLVREILTLTTQYYFCACIPMFVAVGIFYLPLLKLLATVAYQGPTLLIWELGCFMVLLGFEQVLTFATFLDNSQFSVWVRGSALICNVLLNVVLLGTLGLEAAALAAVLSMFLVIAFDVWFLRGMVGYRFPWGSVVVMMLAGAGMGLAGTIVLALLGKDTFGYAVVAGAISLPVYVAIEAIQKRSVARALFSKLAHGGAGASEADIFSAIGRRNKRS